MKSTDLMWLPIASNIINLKRDKPSVYTLNIRSFHIALTWISQFFTLRNMFFVVCRQSLILTLFIHIHRRWKRFDVIYHSSPIENPFISLSEELTVFHLTRILKPKLKKTSQNAHKKVWRREDEKHTLKFWAIIITRKWQTSK